MRPTARIEQAASSEHLAVAAYLRRAAMLDWQSKHGNTVAALMTRRERMWQVELERPAKELGE